jgi:ABC-type antimicrobial peptide transport system permease subunit
LKARRLRGRDIAERDAAGAQPIVVVTPMRERVSTSLSSSRLNAAVMATFTLIAVVLAAAGIYATLVFFVGQRRRELAIRMAVGARPIDVVSLVTRQGTGLVVMGLALGLGGSLALARTLDTLVFGVPAIHPPTLVAAALTLLGVALLACVLPLHAATRTDPLASLRSE